MLERLAVLLCALAANLPALAESRCYGTVSHGRLEGAVSLPLGGPNFSAYSAVAAAAGRTNVHSTVADTVTAAYAALATAMPAARFVYGETGLAQGGPFKPHKTHQNGASVDFFVPVRNATGAPAPLPTADATHFGYDIEFDNKGKYGQYQIDFAALAEHLYRLDRAAKARGIAITNVIIEPHYLAPLFATPRGPYLKASLPFMRAKPWVRHDEHYHVDFLIACQPLV